MQYGCTFKTADIETNRIGNEVFHEYFKKELHPDNNS